MSAGDEGLGIDWPDAPGLPPGYVEDLELGPDDDETLERQELEPTEDERWAEVGAGLVSILDALSDVIARLDKIENRLDASARLAAGYADRLAAVEAAVGRLARGLEDQPALTVSAPVVTREQADEIAAAVLARLHRAKQRQ